MSRLTRKLDPTILCLIALVIVIAGVGAMFSDRFGTLANAANLYEQAASISFVALGQTVVILTGGIDLSIGGVISLAASLTSGFINGDPRLVWPVVAAVLVLGALVGLLNGALVHALRVHPLIVTLGMAAVMEGVVLLYTLKPIGSVPEAFQDFAFDRVGGIPIATSVAVVCFAVVAFILRYTRLGRQIYVFGGDQSGARLVGVPIARVTLFVYALSGLCAAATGVLLVSRLGVGDPLAGQGYELRSITPVVIGGTLLSGGRGGVGGTLLGVLLVQTTDNVLNFMGVSSYYQWMTEGLLVIAAVSIYVDRRGQLT
jgi:ribose transport system permease protein